MKDAAKWQTDWPRVFAGQPYTTDGMTDEQVAQHTTRIPKPIIVGARDDDGTERRPEPQDVYPGGPWHQLSIVTPDGPKPHWAHVDMMKRAAMWQFKKAPDPRDRAATAGFDPTHGRKDLA